MTDTLTQLLENALDLVDCCYYSAFPSRPGKGMPSLVGALSRSVAFPIIAEVKTSAPIRGRVSEHKPLDLIACYHRGSAAALSVLTEPIFFGGGLNALRAAADGRTPVLMKDVVVSQEQVMAGASRGASAVLLIESALSHPLARARADVLIDLAHREGMEVVLEASTEAELLVAMERDADVIGINQRDLRTMRLDGELASDLLRRFRPSCAKPMIVMSGITSKYQLVRLRDLGADGALVGTHLASSSDPELALRALEVPR
jgi:indole-3-glycerol phosphate synthase